jgi:hypothetical protein
VKFFLIIWATQQQGNFGGVFQRIISVIDLVFKGGDVPVLRIGTDFGVMAYKRLLID